MGGEGVWGNGFGVSPCAKRAPRPLLCGRGGSPSVLIRKLSQNAVGGMARAVRELALPSALAWRPSKTMAFQLGANLRARLAFEKELQPVRFGVFDEANAALKLRLLGFARRLLLKQFDPGLDPPHIRAIVGEAETGNPKASGKVGGEQPGNFRGGKAGGGEAGSVFLAHKPICEDRPGLLRLKRDQFRL